MPRARETNRRNGVLGKVALLVVSIVVAVLLGEAILRLGFLVTDDDGYHVWPPHLRKVFRPSPNVMPGISGESQFAVNSLGLRGDELLPSHDFRILVIGGSTTECLYLDQSETWPRLLQDALDERWPERDVWVGNAGMSGRTTRHHLMALKHLPLDELRIDVVVMMIGGNDFAQRLAADDSYDPHALDRPGAEERLVAETFVGKRRPPPPETPFYRTTATWRLLRDLKRIVLRENIQDEAGAVYVRWRYFGCGTIRM